VYKHRTEFANRPSRGYTAAKPASAASRGKEGFMKHGLFGCSVVTLALLAIAGSAAAHHPPRFDRCKLYTVSGQVERVDWMNPHVTVAIKSDDGMSYDLVWLNLQQLSLAGIQKDTLKVGDRVIVKGSKQSEDPTHVSMLLTEIHKESDGLDWSHPPQGC
jgi:hypothetical protein